MSENQILWLVIVVLAILLFLSVRRSNVRANGLIFCDLTPSALAYEDFAQRFRPRLKSAAERIAAKQKAYIDCGRIVGDGSWGEVESFHWNGGKVPVIAQWAFVVATSSGYKARLRKETGEYGTPAWIVEVLVLASVERGSIIDIVA